MNMTAPNGKLQPNDGGKPVHDQPTDEPFTFRGFKEKMQQALPVKKTARRLRVRLSSKIGRWRINVMSNAVCPTLVRSVQSKIGRA
jgi:hypothetical protein